MDYKFMLGPGSLANFTGATNLPFITLNGTGYKAFTRFPVPKTGVIDTVGVFVQQVTGSPANHTVGITIPDANGVMTANAYGGSATVSWAPVQGWNWIPLDTPANAVTNDWVTVGIIAPTFVAGNYIQAAYGGFATVLGQSGYNTSGTIWSYGSPTAFRYADGSIYGQPPSTINTSVTIDLNSTPNEVGCAFRSPANLVCYGARVAIYLIASSICADLCLYDGSNNLLATVTNLVSARFPKRFCDFIWSSPITLSKNQLYRLTFKATAASQFVYPLKYAFESSASLAAFPFGDWTWTQRTGSGDWSEDNTATSPLAIWVSTLETTSVYSLS